MSKFRQTLSMWVDREGFEGENYYFTPETLLNDVNLPSTLLTAYVLCILLFISGGRNLREDALIILGLYHVLGLALPT